MKVSSKEIKRALRDLENISSDLINAPNESYETLIQRFISFITNNSIMNKIVTPLLQREQDYQKYIKDFGNGWGDLIIPPNVNEHISMVFTLFYDFLEGKKSVMDFTLTYYRSDNINNNLYQFNTSFVQPALRELINKINDFIEDEVEGKDEIEYGNIQVFQIGSISNQNGNIAIGSNISITQNENINNLPEEFAKAILQNGFSLKELDEVREEIEELKIILQQNEIKEPKVKKIFGKILDVGGKIMVDILLKIISKPELTTLVLQKIF